MNHSGDKMQLVYVPIFDLVPYSCNPLYSSTKTGRKTEPVRCAAFNCVNKDHAESEWKDYLINLLLLFHNPANSLKMEK